MKVWVVERYSYDPESPLGVYKSKKAAYVALEGAGFKPNDESSGHLGKRTWSHEDGWFKACLTGYELEM